MIINFPSKRMSITFAGVLVITQLLSTPVYAGSITIAPNGVIYTQKTQSVLGETTNAQIEAIQAKMKAEGDALLARFNAGEITYEQLQSGKAEIVAKYKTEMQAAKKSLTESANKNTEQTQVKNNAEQIQIKTTQENKIRIETAPTSKTVSQPLAEEDELIFTQKIANNDESKVRITARDQNKYMMTEGYMVKVNTPLSYNLDTNQMTVTTPAGNKTVTILPDQAFKQAKLVADTTKDNMELIEYQNSPTYTVSGTANKKVFGLFPVSFDKKVYVSAISGNIVKSETSGINRLLDLISF